MRKVFKAFVFTACFAGIANAADPVKPTTIAAEAGKVSVNPESSKLLSSEPKKVLEGTLVTPPKYTIQPESPSLSTRFSNSIQSVFGTATPDVEIKNSYTVSSHPSSTNCITPCVPAPTLCCDSTCGKPVFGGTLLNGGACTDVCSSPGRASLLGGWFSKPFMLFLTPTLPVKAKSDCGTCSATACSTGSCSTDSCTTGSCASHDRGCWQKFKDWLCFQPSKGPRQAFFRASPYFSNAIVVMPQRNVAYGSTCFSNANCGSCRNLGLGQNCASQNCTTQNANCAGSSCDASGCGNGLGHKLCHKGAKDCNGESSVHGTTLSDGLRFATNEYPCWLGEEQGQGNLIGH
jgi:hypothetical protein